MTPPFHHPLQLKVAFFRKYDAFFSLPQKCAKNYPEKEILKLRSVQSQLTLTPLQCLRAGKFKIQSLGQNTAHFFGNGHDTNIFLRISDLYHFQLFVYKFHNFLFQLKKIASRIFQIQPVKMTMIVVMEIVNILKHWSLWIFAYPNHVFVMKDCFVWLLNKLNGLFCIQPHKSVYP